MANGDLPNDDEALWQQVVADLVPLKGRNDSLIKKGEDKVIINSPPPALFPMLATQNQVKLLEIGDVSRVDGSVAKKLQSGSYPIDATLDLHGKTQDEAFAAIQYYMGNAYNAGKRCILVVTGKGVQGKGVLRQQLHKWLSAPGIAEYILAITQAKPEHGGGGAFYVLLRRQR